LLLLTGAGARLFIPSLNGSHAPTATVIVLDNSLSSGLVVGEIRLLDELKAIAFRTLDVASDEDRFWVIRAGEPWLPAIPGSMDAARRVIEQSEVSEAGSDLSSAIERAVRLLETSNMEHHEIHLLSDLQNTAFSMSRPAVAQGIPVVTWTGHKPQVTNRALTSVVVGGGLPPLEGQPASVTIESLESTFEGDTMHVPIRLVLNERIRGAAALPPGAQTTISIPSSGTGWVTGYADADPDDLRADDRRFFAYQSRLATKVAAVGDVGVFVTEALAVLGEAERVEQVSAAEADVVISANGIGLDQAYRSAVIVPAADLTLIPGLNRRLANSGIPWRLEPREETGGTSLKGQTLPDPLRGVQASSWFNLTISGDPPAPPRVIAEVSSRPWAVEGIDSFGRPYMLLASSLDEKATSLPVSTGMLRFVDWITSEWAGSSGLLNAYLTGSTVPVPSAATHVRFPSGREVEIDGTRTVRGTGEAGFYTFFRQDSILSILALNPPSSESFLDPIEASDLKEVIGNSVIPIDRKEAWDLSVYRARQGPELWWPLLLGMLLLLLAEALMATSGPASPLSGLGGSFGSTESGD
tara:strand:+ start:171 stop:1919 length:1749 start_codon:yes stop_codon:yes gene_type:complete